MSLITKQICEANGRQGYIKVFGRVKHTPQGLYSSKLKFLLEIEWDCYWGRRFLIRIVYVLTSFVATDKLSRITQIVVRDYLSEISH